MHVKKIALLLASTSVLLFGIGAAGAGADDDGPNAPAEACTVVAPVNSEDNAANAVSGAAQDVSQEADDQEADDEQGDAQDENDNQGEQGDCENENDDEGNGGDDD